VRDEYLMQLRLDPGARQASQRVIAVRVPQVEGLQPQPIRLKMAQLTSGKALNRALRKLLEFLWMDPDSSGRERRLHQSAISDREDDAVFPSGYAPDALARQKSRPSHALPVPDPAIPADDQKSYALPKHAQPGTHSL
jgi:hypothetical protein